MSYDESNRKALRPHFTDWVTNVLIAILITAVLIVNSIAAVEHHVGLKRSSWICNWFHGISGQDVNEIVKEYFSYPPLTIIVISSFSGHL